VGIARRTGELGIDQKPFHSIEREPKREAAQTGKTPRKRKRGEQFVRPRLNVTANF
jgi:hypothetical protein